MITRLRRFALATCLAFPGVGLGSAAVLAGPPAPPAGVMATFEGRVIDLSEGWGDARACWGEATATRRYRSEAEMDAAEVRGTGAAWTVMAACSSSLRLYTGTSFGGSVLSLTTTGSVINLSGYGFSNVTSSYRVGACSASFYDTTSGGTLYPGSTSAGTQAASMASGWDNRVSSVYIF